MTAFLTVKTLPVGHGAKRREKDTVTNEAKWEELRQEEDIAYFRADLRLYSLESYTLEEKKSICNEMMRSSKAILDCAENFAERRSRAPSIAIPAAPGRASSREERDVVVF